MVKPANSLGRFLNVPGMDRLTTITGLLDFHSGTVYLGFNEEHSVGDILVRKLCHLETDSRGVMTDGESNLCYKIQEQVDVSIVRAAARRMRQEARLQPLKYWYRVHGD